MTVACSGDCALLEHLTNVLTYLISWQREYLNRWSTSDHVFVDKMSHITPTLIQLYWLLVSYRIKFKLCCLIHVIYYGRSPSYLTETVQSVGASRSHSGLSSSSTSPMDYSLPRLHTSSMNGRSHMWVPPPGTLCPTTSAPWLIQSSSENYWNHTFSQVFNICWFLCFSQSFNFWLTFIMHNNMV